MVGAIGAASGYDTIFSIGYSSRVNATRADFRVPESPITGQTEEIAPTQTRDPIQDSIELSRDFPQLVLGQTYTPPMEQQVAFAIRDSARSSGASDSEEQSDYLNNQSLLYEGLASEEQADSEEGDGENDPTTVNEAGGGNSTGAENLSEEEQQQVKDLSNRDREVRAHEQAHQSAGGSYAGAMSFEYEQGPDGQRYAVGGEVAIDISKEKNPEETIAKMQQVKAAAMAPAQPSAQDYKVSAQATQQESEARAEMNKPAENGDSEDGEAEGVNGAQAASGDGEDSAENGQGLGGMSEGDGSRTGGISGGNGGSEGGTNNSGSISSSSRSSSSSSTSSSPQIGGGVASLRNGVNPYAKYSRMASMASASASMEQMGGQQQFQMSSAERMSEFAASSYRPINIVA